MRKPLMLILAVAAVVSLLPRPGHAQSQDPLIGTWNLSGTVAGSPFIAVMTFNTGGTTLEIDTEGTNSSASPGESVSMGTWNKTGSLRYSFKEQNYDYDETGALSSLTVTTCSVTLASSRNSFADSCVVSFYTCSVSSCPGTFISSTGATANGVRF
jgi:hypothetical protein